MAVLRMKRITVCGNKNCRKAILEELQRMGTLEPESSVVEDESFVKMDTAEAKQKFEKVVSLLEQALEVLNTYAPEKKSMFAALEGKRLVNGQIYGQSGSDKNEGIATAKRLISLQNQYIDSSAEITRIRTRQEMLLPWMKLDIPMETEGTQKTACLIGVIGKEIGRKELLETLAAIEGTPDVFEVRFVSSDKNQTCLCVICMKEDREKMEESLRKIGFARPANVIYGIPAVSYQNMEQEINTNRQKMESIKREIAEEAAKRRKLEVLADYYRVRAQKYEVLGTLPQSEHTFFISGYIAEKKAQEMKETLESKYQAVVEIEDLLPEEEPPVILENGTFAQSMESVLTSYGLPAKGEVDPSGVMAVFYIFLFGLMLSDAAYGFLIFVACTILLRKFPRMSASMKSAIRMFQYCGVSTLVWGILFGGYFGDLITVVSRTFLGKEIIIPPLWFAPLEDPMKLLIYSMLFGVIHLFVGLGMKGYMYLRDHRYMDFFSEVVLWYTMLIGLILMLLPTSLFYSISQMEFNFPPAVQTLSKILAAGGAIGILLMAGHRKKNPLLRLALGAYDLYNITGWLSDVLSYSRLLALGLATGVIASVINQMGSMMGKGIGGAVFFLVVFVIGHTFNIAINLLGAYVHTCRLQYIEFFGKFFEGGGRVFHPFSEETRYVEYQDK